MQNNNTQLSPTKAATQAITSKKEATVQLCRLRSSFSSNAPVLPSVQMSLMGFVQTALEILQVQCNLKAGNIPVDGQATAAWGGGTAAQSHYHFFLSFNWTGECIGSTHSCTNGRPIIVAVPHTLPDGRTSELRTFCASTHLS